MGQASSGAPSVRFFGWFIFAALAALAALECRGLAAANLFHRDLWYPEGPWLSVQFAGIYAACSATILILVPWMFARLCCASALVLASIVAGPQALAAAAFFLCSAWCLGRLAGRVTGFAALLLGISIYIFLMSLLARVPLHYPAVYIAVLAVPIVLGRRDLPLLLRPPALRLDTWGERAAFAAMVLLLAAHLFAALKPEAGADALAVHLAVPANIAAHRALTIEPARFVWAVMPMAADFLFTLAYVPGGEFAARLVHFAMLPVLLGLLYSLARRWVSRAVALLLAALLASTPMALGLTSSLLAEHLLAALLLGSLGALWQFADSGGRRLACTAAVLAGTAVAAKFGALVVVALALPFAIYEFRRARLPRGARWAAAALLLAAAAPPYATAWATTGNPVFPFFNSRFHSPLLPRIDDIRDVRFHQPLTWSAPFDLTFHTARYYEGRDGSFGFQYLVLAPLALLTLLVSPRRQTVAAAAIALGAALLILRSEANARYLYGVLPLLYLPCSALIGWAAARQRALYRSLLAMCVGCLALNACLVPAQGYYYTFYPPFNEARRRILLRDTAPIRLVIAWFNRAHPGAPVLLLEDSDATGLQGEVYENHWHQMNTWDAIRHAEGTAGIRRVLDQWRVQHVIGRLPSAGYYVRPETLRRLLDNCAVPEFALKEFYVARLEPGCYAAAISPPSVPAITVDPGIYDDFDPRILFIGGWERDPQVAGAFRGTITRNLRPGASAAFAFRGSEITWVHTRAPSRGRAAVTIDGVDKGTFDLSSPETQWQSRLRFINSDAGPHVMVIRVISGFVDVDSFEVR